MDCKEVYFNVLYHGKVDNYVFDHIQEEYKHIPRINMYNGEEYHNTLSQRTIEKLIENV